MNYFAPLRLTRFWAWVLISIPPIIMIIIYGLMVLFERNSLRDFVVSNSLEDFLPIIAGSLSLVLYLFTCYNIWKIFFFGLSLPILRYIITINSATNDDPIALGLAISIFIIFIFYIIPIICMVLVGFFVRFFIRNFFSFMLVSDDNSPPPFSFNIFGLIASILGRIIILGCLSITGYYGYRQLIGDNAPAAATTESSGDILMTGNSGMIGGDESSLIVSGGVSESTGTTQTENTAELIPPVQNPSQEESVISQKSFVRCGAYEYEFDDIRINDVLAVPRIVSLFQQYEQNDSSCLGGRGKDGIIAIAQRETSDNTLQIVLYNKNNPDHVNDPFNQSPLIFLIDQNNNLWYVSQMGGMDDLLGKRKTP